MRYLIHLICWADVRHNTSNAADKINAAPIGEGHITALMRQVEGIALKRVIFTVNTKTIQLKNGNTWDKRGARFVFADEAEMGTIKTCVAKAVRDRWLELFDQMECDESEEVTASRVEIGQEAFNTASDVNIEDDKKLFTKPDLYGFAVPVITKLYIDPATRRIQVVFKLTSVDETDPPKDEFDILSFTEGL